ncbi:hypothetical protein ACFY9C_22565 [Streptomyces filamentosus]|uniref:hypothetical protein n=1 Tax=Streptomyces filamentosus TaxID=67294 RepID=UPI0036ECF913
MTLVPAAMALLGRRAWSMPRRLDRLLPGVDIEGARLPAAVPAATPHVEKKTPHRKTATRV